MTKNHQNSLDNQRNFLCNRRALCGKLIKRVLNALRPKTPGKNILRNQVPCFLDWNLQSLEVPSFRAQLLSDPPVVSIQNYHLAETCRRVYILLDSKWPGSRPGKILFSKNYSQFWCPVFPDWSWRKEDGISVDWWHLSSLRLSLLLLNT